MSWNEFLQILSQPNGIAVGVGLVESVLVEYVPGFDPLAAKWKRLVFLLVAMVIPLAATGLGIATEGWAVSWQDTFWPAVLSGGTAFASGTFVHMKMKQIE
jgi:hypothetical protein